jgi:hypothetical protein
VLLIPHRRLSINNFSHIRSKAVAGTLTHLHFIDDSDLRPSRPCPTMPTDGNPSQFMDLSLTMCSRWEYLQQSYSKYLVSEEIRRIALL